MSLPPGWTEGLAVFNQEVQDPAEEAAVEQAVRDGNLMPLKVLSGSFGATDEEAVLSYGESHSAVDFIMKDSRYGPEKFSRTVAAFREGVTYDDAMKAGLGVTVDELNSQWEEYLQKTVPQEASTRANEKPGADRRHAGGGAGCGGTLRGIVDSRRDLRHLHACAPKDC